MAWSWKIGRLAGIDLYVHFTFFLLLAFFAVQFYSVSGEVWDAIVGVLFILTLFGIVILHELGHALAARRYGVGTRDITLLPIGGVARLERIPEDPKQELVIALAGPAVNVVLALALFVVLGFGGVPTQFGDLGRFGDNFLNFLAQLFLVNVLLAVFNLVPAFPMDGGRVLRALLAMRLDYVRATQVAAGLGQAIAILFGLWGMFAGNPFLIFIAIFVWFGAAQEASLVQIRSALGGIPVMRAMITNFQALRPADPLSRAVEHVLAGFQEDFPVVDDGGQLVGVLTRKDMSASLAQQGPEARVGDVMQRDYVTANPREMLETAFMRLQDCGCHTLPVVKDGQLMGLLTTDNVTEVLMIQEALREAHRRRDLPRSIGGEERSPVPQAHRPVQPLESASSAHSSTTK